jgi:hypothetical protein
MNRLKTIKSDFDCRAAGVISMKAYRHGLREVHVFGVTGPGLRSDVLVGDARCEPW